MTDSTPFTQQPELQHDGPYQGQQGPYFGPYGGRWMPESLTPGTSATVSTRTTPGTS